MLTLSEYRKLIELDNEFAGNDMTLSEENHVEAVDKLLFRLNKFVEKIADVNSLKNYAQKRQLLRATLNTLAPFTLKKDDIRLLDNLLQSELQGKKITAATSIPTQKNAGNTAIKIWQGDITTLKADAIVNAANSAMLGCFQPLHACIDNAIHSGAGVQLRDDCAKIMELQSHSEPTGTAKITKAYNLPARYVLHTVGPIVQGAVTLEHERLLADSYTNCLEVAKEIQSIRSIAFCCISTGVFGYPPEPAAQTAFKTVVDWVENHPNVFDIIVFNVFSNRDRDIYQTIFQQ